MAPPSGGNLLCLLVLLVCLEKLPKMDAMECFSTEDGRMTQSVCRPTEVCCGSKCCEQESPFYTHWYFWLAVCMFLMVVVGFALSACRHFRKQRKSQTGCQRTKLEFGADLLLNYHLVRTDVISLLPQYGDVTSRSSHLLNIAPSSSTPPPPPPFLPPPSYCDVCISSNSSSSNSNNMLGRHNDQAPPSYTECVMQKMTQN
ncbi:hypothetical protein ACOMHN_064260 [Nucella lapillus]